MLDQAELDFGIYRIMNQKRKDIDKYLDEDLVKQVQAVISENASGKSKKIEKEIEEATAQAHALGIDPNALPKIKELKDQLAILGSAEDMENDVYSHLATFFSRYYEGGDFISQRRYKKDVYAIPYEGEEVKLHWANADQYYIKTSEYFRTYSFKTNSGKKVEFTLKDATVEQNNNKAQGNQERRFAIYEEKPFEVIDGVMHVNFTYELMPKTTKQSDLISKAFEMVKPLVTMDFIEVLTTLCPTDKNSKRTLLEKHLNDYVARNTFDYFIHKDLHGFLSRELDFYIKNEILFIDDINAKNDNEFLQYLTVIKAVKAIGGKIIEFLSSLENFQKKLWLKKKFVVESNYCITLDRIPEEFYDEIAENDAQREEWVRLFAIDLIKGETPTAGGLFGPSDSTVGYSTPLSIEFLKQNTLLPLDTSNFSKEFKDRLLSSICNIDQVTNGLLVYSENFQALRLLREKYRNAVSGCYIDPPFNLGEDADYLYKVDYRNSTWISLIYDRVIELKNLLDESGSLFVRCSHDGNMFLRMMLNEAYGIENYRNEIILRRAEETKGDLNKQFETIRSITVNYDNLYWFTKNPASRFKRIKKRISEEKAGSHWHSFWKAFDRPTMRYNILGIDLNNYYGQWMWAKDRAMTAVANYQKYLEEYDRSGISLDEYWEKTGKQLEFVKRDGDKISAIKYWIPPRTEVMADTNWLDIKGYANKWGFKTENSEAVLKRVIESMSDENGIVIDFFHGSATTAAVAMKTARKFIGIEMGETQFTSVELPRLKNVLYGERSGVSNECTYSGGGMFKYIRLEQYEDTLNNLIAKEENALFADNEQFNNSYMLGYMLDTDTKDSLFNLKWFENPFDVTLKVTRNNEMKEQKIDMVDTFNYLIGLNVDSISYPKKGICTVEGVTRRGEKTLIIWRDCTKVDNAALETFFSKSAYSTKGDEFDRIYINGDNNLENLRTSEEHWKVVLTEEEFSKRMFEE